MKVAPKDLSLTDKIKKSNHKGPRKEKVSKEALCSR